MRAVLVTSTAPYSGKSGIALALVRELALRGLDVGYFKPFGAMPVTVDGVLTDEDALYVNRSLSRPGPLADVCPVVRTQAFVEQVLSHEVGDLAPRVAEAYASCSEGRDAMVIEGPSDPFQAKSVELAAVTLSGLLDARMLLIDRPRGTHLPDEVLACASVLGDRLGGVLLNWVHEGQLDFISRRVVPFLSASGVTVFGVLPADAALSSVTVAEIVDALGGTVLCAEDRLGDPVESFMVGAMGQDKALRFFRRKARKAVITGGDRADVQLAALETSTRALILTGNMPPSSLVLARAEELGVPMVLVDTDTLTAVEKMEALMGRVRLHDPEKAARIHDMLCEATDMNAVLGAFDLA
ncbi:MAG: phosphotransacetylase family protein [Anaerosomatales bacterium]|nr:phosphotransacetylase family protein [Anaerosomatales bacterium]